MKLDQIDLHGKNKDEALLTVEKNVRWIIDHDKIGVVLIHGKGKHSNHVAILKQEVRRYLEENEELLEHGYLVLKGEDDFRITETFDEGQVLIVKEGYENESFVDGKKQEEKTKIVYDYDGKDFRKHMKKNRKTKARRKNKSANPLQCQIDDGYKYDIHGTVLVDNVRGLENPGSGMLVQIAYINNGCVVAGPIIPECETIGQLSQYEGMPSLSQRTKETKLLKKDLPQMVSIPRDYFFASDIRPCFIGTVLAIVRGNQEDIRIIILT